VAALGVNFEKMTMFAN